MQHTQIVSYLLLPPHQQAAEAVHPGVGPFHHPAPRPIAWYRRFLLLFFPTATDVGCVPPLGHQLLDLRIIIPLVQTDMLRSLGTGCGPGYYYRFQGGGHQLHGMAVGPSYAYPNGDALTFGQQGTFDSPLTPVGGIAAGGLSPREEPWSWPHPGLAIPTQCPSRCHTPTVQPATSPRKPQLVANADCGHGACWVHRIPAAGLSIGSQSVGSRRYRPWPGGLLSRGGPPLGGASWLAAKVQYEPIAHLEYASHRQRRISLFSWHHSSLSTFGVHDNSIFKLSDRLLVGNSTNPWPGSRCKLATTLSVPLSRSISGQRNPRTSDRLSPVYRAIKNTSW